MTNTTAALFGLPNTAVPDDVLSLLAFGKARLVYEEITQSKTWTAPETLLGNKVFAILSGGGGGEGTISDRSGGGSGYISISEVAVTPGQQVTALVGAAGAQGSAGGTTSFGSSSAAGGNPGNGYNGGNGNAGGGAGYNRSASTGGTGGNGGAYGGGGGGYFGNGGPAGAYQGGGGGGLFCDATDSGGGGFGPLAYGKGGGHITGANSGVVALLYFVFEEESA